MVSRKPYRNAKIKSLKFVGKNVGDRVSVLRAKIKIPQNQRSHGIFDGRSDWIRTSGHLNPIQVLYQTEPHPGGVAIRCACSLSCKQESLTRSAIAPYSRKRKRFREALRRFLTTVLDYSTCRIKNQDFFEKIFEKFFGALKNMVRGCLRGLARFLFFM